MGQPETAILGTSYNFTSCSNKQLATAVSNYMSGLKASGQLDQIFAAANVASAEEPPLTLPTESCSAA